MNLENFKNKKIAILGFGKEGKSTFEFFKKNGIEVAAVLDKDNGLTYLDHVNQFDLLVR